MSNSRYGLCPHTPRKRLLGILLLLTAGVFTVFNSSSYTFPREDLMEERIADMQSHIQFLTSMYRAREEDVMNMQTNVYTKPRSLGDSFAKLSPEITNMLRNMSGTKTAEGVKNLQLIRTPLMYQLLPHLMTDPYSLRPAFHMRAKRHFADIVIGIPTVKRDKESYLMLTLSHLINGAVEEDINKTLIIVFIGETDLEYVLQTAKEVENIFSKQVAMGLIEVLSPASSFYPDFDVVPPTLGDSAKRFRWRTKQNLDTMYLMAYAQTRGTYYLMLEDDVIAKKDYIKDIKAFTAETTINNPFWFIIEYCPVGGIGKLFKSADLLHFITYLQLFYTNMPIDWLMESYLADRTCTLRKQDKLCEKNKLKIRPRYRTSLFMHVGLYSSLKGKLQKVKNHRGKVPTFYAHTNPSLKSISSDITEIHQHSLDMAYQGKTFFWGSKPKKGDTVVFNFEKPITLESYLFRSGNTGHANDRFYNTVVEVLPTNNNSTYVNIGTFDEFGLAEGQLGKEYGPILAIRLRVTKDQKDTNYWVILSEIELKLMESMES